VSARGASETERIRITPRFKRVDELYAGGRSYDQIAVERNIAKATVGTRLIRARKKPRDALLREIGGAR